MTFDWLRAAHLRLLKEPVVIRLSIWMGLLLTWFVVVAAVVSDFRLAGTPWWAYLGVAAVSCAFVAFDAVPTISTKCRDRKRLHGS